VRDEREKLAEDVRFERTEDRAFHKRMEQASLSKEAQQKQAKRLMNAMQDEAETAEVWQHAISPHQPRLTNRLCEPCDMQ